MNTIIVLGWGSLIWDTERNKQFKFQIKGQWYKDGPLLPIEYARLSGGSRLTLVLFSTAKKVPVLWAYLNVSSVEDGINMLKLREGTSDEKKIGFLDLINGKSRCNTVPNVLDEIEQWARRKEVAAVIWTDLKANFSEKTKTEFTYMNVLEFLKTHSSAAIEKYIRKTPTQIRTKLRGIIEHELGWYPI